MDGWTNMENINWLTPVTVTVILGVVLGAIQYMTNSLTSRISELNEHISRLYHRIDEIPDKMDMRYVRIEVCKAEQHAVQAQLRTLEVQIPKGCTCNDTN